jgi:nucleoid-associated protein YgaU/DNA-binding SARP family transcriptional activator
MRTQALLLRRLAGLCQLLGASLGLLALVAGIPLGLVFGVGFPRSVPSWSDVVNQLQTQGIPTQALLYLLAALCWVLWAYLMWCLVIEAVSLVRRSSGRQRGVGKPGRLLAGALLATLFVGLQLMSSRADPPRAVTPLAAGLAPRTSVTTVYHPATTAGTAASLLSSSPSPSGGQEVQVQPGDSLWAIAGREYGNPQEWTQIWGANQGQTEDNGQPFTDPSLIDPGWELEVPDPSSVGAATPPQETPTSGSADTSAAAPPPPALTTEQQVEVQPGDSLWAISGREYGNPQDWTDIWGANREETEDNGQTFTDPSVIDPEWELAVPALGATSTASSATAEPPTPTQAVAPASGFDPHDIGSTLPSLAPSLAPVAPSVQAGGAPASPPTPTPTPTPAPAAAPAAALPPSSTVTSPHSEHPAIDAPVSLAEGGVIAAATAAALVGLLLSAQRHERWRRRPGTAGGSRVAVLARRPSLRRVRAALASATARYGTEVQADGPHAATFPDTLEQLQGVPGRILIGRREVGGPEVAVDIDDLHRLALAGPGAENAARAILVSFLAHHAWWDAEAIVAAGAVGRTLITTPVGTPGLDELSVDGFLAHLEATIRRQREALDRNQQHDWHERVGGPDPLEALLAVIRSEDLSPEQLQRCGSLADDARGCSVALVLVGPLVDAPWSRPLTVAADGSVAEPSTDLVGGASLLYRMSEGEAVDLVTVVAAGRGPDVIPDLSADEEEGLAIVADVAEESRPASDSAAASVATPARVLTLPAAFDPRRVEIRIYGRVRILLDGRELIKGLPDAGRQVLALLAVRGELSEEEGISALGAGSPDQVWRGRWTWGTRGTRAALRKLLGDDSIDPLPPGRGVVRLNPDIVGSDYGRLVAGREAATRMTAPEDRRVVLARATDDLRGEPFAGAPYNWLVEEQEGVRALAIDTLRDLAHLHADLGDLDAAVLTMDQALSIDPDPIEDLFRQQIIWQHRLGRSDAARDLYHRLTRELSERCDVQPSEETLLLMESLAARPHLVAGG